MLGGGIRAWGWDEGKRSRAATQATPPPQTDTHPATHPKSCLQKVTAYHWRVCMKHRESHSGVAGWHLCGSSQQGAADVYTSLLQVQGAVT